MTDEPTPQNPSSSRKRVAAALAILGVAGAGVATVLLTHGGSTPPQPIASGVLGASTSSGNEPATAAPAGTPGATPDAGPTPVITVDTGAPTPAASPGTAATPVPTAAAGGGSSTHTGAPVRTGPTAPAPVFCTATGGAATQNWYASATDAQHAVRISTHITNTGARACADTSATNVSIRDAAGNVVFAGGSSGTTSNQPSWQAGETLTSVFPWQQLESNGRQAPPGNYTATVSWPSWGGMKPVVLAFQIVAVATPAPTPSAAPTASPTP